MEEDDELRSLEPIRSVRVIEWGLNGGRGRGGGGGEESRAEDCIREGNGKGKSTDGSA
jgi:hypothetical protein